MGLPGAGDGSGGGYGKSDSGGASSGGSKRCAEDMQGVQGGDSKIFAVEDGAEDGAEGDEGRDIEVDGRGNGENGIDSTKETGDSRAGEGDGHDDNSNCDDELSRIQATEVQALAQLHALKRSLQARTDNLESNLSPDVPADVGRKASQDVSVQTSPVIDVLKAAPLAVDVEWAREQLQHEVLPEPELEFKSGPSLCTDEQLAPGAKSTRNQQEQQRSNTDQQLVPEAKSTQDQQEQQQEEPERAATPKSTVDESFTLSTEREVRDTVPAADEDVDLSAAQKVPSPQDRQQPAPYSISLSNSDTQTTAGRALEQPMSSQQQQHQPAAYSIALAHSVVDTVPVASSHDVPSVVADALPSPEPQAVAENGVRDETREVAATTSPLQRSATESLLQLSPFSATRWAKFDGHFDEDQVPEEQYASSPVRSSNDFSLRIRRLSEDHTVSTHFDSAQKHLASKRWQLVRAEVRSGKFARGSGNEPVRVAEGHCMMYDTASRMAQDLEPKLEQATKTDVNAERDTTRTNATVTSPTRESEELEVARTHDSGKEAQQRRSVHFGDSPSPIAPAAMSSGDNKTSLRLRELEKRHSLNQESATKILQDQRQLHATVARHSQSQNSAGPDDSDLEGSASDIAAMKSEIARVSFAGSTPPMRRASRNSLSASPALALSPKAREYQKEFLQEDQIKIDHANPFAAADGDSVAAKRTPMDEDTIAKAVAPHAAGEVKQRKCTPPAKRASVRFSTPSPTSSTDKAMDVDTMNSSSALDLLPPLTRGSSPKASAPADQGYEDDFDVNMDIGAEEGAPQEYEDDFDEFEDPMSDGSAKGPFWQTKGAHSDIAARHANMQAEVSSDEEFGHRSRKAVSRSNDENAPAPMKVVVYAAANPAHRKRLIVERQMPWDSFLEKVCTVLAIPQPGTGVNIVVQDEEVGADVTDTADIMSGDELAVAVIREAIDAPSQLHRARRISRSRLRKTVALGNDGAKMTDTSHNKPSVMQSVSLPRVGAPRNGTSPDSGAAMAAGHNVSGRGRGEPQISINPLPLPNEQSVANASGLTEAASSHKGWNDGFGRRRGPRPANEHNLRLKKRGPTNQFGIELAYGSGAARPTARMGLGANYSTGQGQQPALSELENLVLANMRKVSGDCNTPIPRHDKCAPNVNDC